MKKNSLFVLLFTFISSFACAQDMISQAQFSETGINTLEVQGSFCRVDITGSASTSSVDFKGEILGNKNPGSVEIKYQRNGSTMRVWIERDNKMVWGNIRGELIFQVPADIHLIVDNSSGSVAVRGIRHTKMSLETSSGSIDAQDIEANSNFHSSSGSIKVMNLKGNIQGQSSSGSQRWEQIQGNIQTVASSESIRFTQVEGNLDAETSSGGIRLENVKGSLNLRASSGSLSGTDVNLMASSSFRTSSGSISMGLVNDVNALSFDLTASSGSLTAGNNRSNKRLYLEKQGTILIKGVTSSGSQKYQN
ncbi:MAG: DUF4097 family beta strand repeat-containing protein [Microscillaceae bacterium]|nr:DUF4097 family beta strand repeat-containing protein [Microscillaceae bacterium]